MNSPEKAIELFYSYSHKDEEARNELEKHLSILNRQGVISEWHDRKISAGTEWAEQIDTHLENATIILLLVSSDFLASDYCYDKELKVALERHEKGEARVIPIIIRSVDWNGSPFGKLQALPTDAKPVTSWDDPDEAFTNIVKGIRQAIEETSKIPPKVITPDVPQLLKKFELRPKKYNGEEFVSKMELNERIEAITSNEASSLKLPLGDAIKRQFIIESSGKKLTKKLYAAGKYADWLESAKLGSYNIRIKFLFGINETTYFEYGELQYNSEVIIGYKLMEVIDVTKEKNLTKKSS